MGSSEIEWDRMGSNRIQWDRVESNGIKWDRLGSNGIKWDRMGSSRIEWAFLHFYFVYSVVSHHTSRKIKGPTFFKSFSVEKDHVGIMLGSQKGHAHSTTYTSCLSVSSLKRSLATATGVRQQPQSFWGREEKKLRSNI